MFGLLFVTALMALIHSVVCEALDNCDEANADCIDTIINETNTRLNYLIYNQSCDHNAVFAKLFLIETEQLRDNITTVSANGSRTYTGNYRNSRWIARTHRLFANFYFNARDHWTAAKINLVSEAWRIAFEAADKRELSALGDALLGINAHINSDLPYVLESIGVKYSDGTSARDDYDRVTNIFCDSIEKIVNNIANNFDSSAAEIYNEATKHIVVHYLKVMRNDQWNNSLELTNSSLDPIAYNAVKARIDSSAVEFANFLKSLFKGNPANRDSFCRSAHGLGRTIVREALDDCDDANPDCIEITIQEMNARLDSLIYDRNCDHNAVFGKLFVIETEHLRNKLTTVAENRSTIYTDYFRNPQWMDRIDRLFANYYFNARDNWSAGETSLVPEAWKIAFESADKRELSALGDALLGLNAHINHDLPYVLSTIGVIHTDGTSGRDDYNRVTNILSDSIDEIVDSIENEFDSSASALYNPVTKNIALKTLMVMRNDQWYNAIELVDLASDRKAYDAVKARIDSSAAAYAKYLRTTFKANSATRDSFCCSAHGLH